MRQPCKQMIEEKAPSEDIILVVEDDDNIGTMLVEAIAQETPYKVMRVNDGFQALQVIKNIKLLLFITDYRLPNMNGIELYDKLQAKSALDNIPTIMISAYLPKAEVQKRHLVSLSKPFDMNVFLDLVERLLQ